MNNSFKVFSQILPFSQKSRFRSVICQKIGGSVEFLCNSWNNLPLQTPSFVRLFSFLCNNSTKPPPPLNEEIFSCSENREHLYATDIVESIVSSSNNCFFSGLMRCCLLLCKEPFSVFVQNYFCMWKVVTRRGNKR